MIQIALVEPENEGNIGAVARVMANFGYKNLVLINPKCNHLHTEAIARSMHGKEVLKKAKIINSIKDLKSDFLIATSSKPATDYNLKRSYISSKEISKYVSKKNSYSLIFGRESSGLNNKEIKQCDLIVKINTNTNYEALNLSHSVAVLLYELNKNEKSNIKLISKKDKEILLDLVKDALDRTKFPKSEMKETQVKLWKNIIAKSNLTKREAVSLMGFFRKVNHQKQLK